MTHPSKQEIEDASRDDAVFMSVATGLLGGLLALIAYANKQYPLALAVVWLTTGCVVAPLVGRFASSSGDWPDDPTAVA